MKQKKDVVVPLAGETYLAVIENSVGTRMFRNFYARANGKKTDIMEDGYLSCAFYVSAVLKIFGLAKEVHGTVNGTVKDMEKRDWVKVRKPRRGDVVVWEPVTDAHGANKHIGFAASESRAISNLAKKGVPREHHITFGVKDGRPRRKITGIYRKRI